MNNTTKRNTVQATREGKMIFEHSFGMEMTSTVPCMHASRGYGMTTGIRNQER